MTKIFLVHGVNNVFVYHYDCWYQYFYYEHEYFGVIVTLTGYTSITIGGKFKYHYLYLSITVTVGISIFTMSMSTRIKQRK